MAPVAVAHLAVDLAAAAFIATLPATVERLGAGGATLGVLVALYSITALGLQPLLGGVADRFGTRITAALTGGASAVALLAAAAAPSILLLVIGVFVGGVASSAFHPAGVALARGVAGDHPEPAVAAFAAAGTIGVGVGPIAGIAVMGASSEPSAMLILAVPALAIGAFVAAGPAGSALPPTTTVSVTTVVRTLGRTATIAVAVAMAVTAIASTLPLLIAGQPGGSTTDGSIGLALGAFSISMAAGGVLGSALVGRIAPSTILQAGLTVGAAAGAVTVLLGPGGPTFFPLLAVTGIALGPAVPLLLVTAQDRLPQHQAAASGVILGFANGLAGTAFLVIASTHGSLGLEPGVLVALATLVPAAALVSRSDRSTPPPRRPWSQVTTCGCALARPPVTPLRAGTS